MYNHDGRVKTNQFESMATITPPRKVSGVSSLLINKGTKYEVRRVMLKREIKEKRELYDMRNVGLS
jgi:hypothetical protein